MAKDDEAVLFRVFVVGEVERHLHTFMFHMIGHRHHSEDDTREVDRLHVGACQFGIESRGIGNIADQSVEPRTSMLNDGEKPRA